MVRLFVLHNFKDGYICSCYWYRLYDDKGELISAWWAPAIWKIHKEDGKWEITEIFEGESI
ncbi:MAG: hypothetical protein GYA50_09790 [Eubacteriaceae bacterium]|nr:hypothetical protein [Eubacteriaceae bacterium]